MKSKNSRKLLSDNNTTFAVLITALILLVPLVSMQFTDEVNWSLMDFITAATLVLGTGLLLSLVIKKVSNNKYRLAIGLTILIVFFCIWTELAVGVFTNWGS
jgi:hypothetical protein